MSEDCQDPRSLLLASLDIPTCRVEFSETPIVLLCGGQVPLKDKADDPNPPLESLRHAITNFDSKFEIFRPEEITGWHSDGIFKDLVSFELELASICSLIVIILESEGALVELGAFSQLPELSNKIFVVCPAKYIDAISFINLGVLRFIAAAQPDSVKSYPWEPKSLTNPFRITEEVIADFSQDIHDDLKKLPKSQVFKTNKNTHVLVLICEFLRLFAALKETEILDYLDICGIVISPEELKGKLFLLKEFQLIKIQKYSDAIFYLSGKQTYHKIRISFKNESLQIDLLRFEIQCLAYYKDNPKHRNRNRAITMANAGYRL
jgi:hypothetical protein